MPRTAINATAAPGAYFTAGVAFTFTASDTSNQNSTPFTGREFIVARNSGASPHNVTITSVSDSRKRTGTITSEAIAAGAFRMYGPFTNAEGWVQSDGSLYFEGDHAEVEFAVIKLPATL